MLEANGPEPLDLLAAKKKMNDIDPVGPILPTVDDRQNHVHKILEQEGNIPIVTGSEFSTT